MDNDVKGRRRYESPRRREQAASTRRGILAAARQLFERDGYAATSVPAIAAEAGVAVKTVYLAFETKATLLRAVWAERLSGDEAAVPVKEQASYREILEETDPERQLRLLAARSRAVKTRSGALMEVIRNATTVDGDIAALWHEIETKLLDVQGSIVGQLHDRNALAHRDVATATDILWTLNHPSVWQLLVRERGWTADQYEQWLGDALCSQLLAVRGTRDAGSPKRPRPSPRRASGART